VTAARSLVFFSAIFVSMASAQETTVVNTKEETSVTYRLIHPLHKIEATSKESNFKLSTDVVARRLVRVSAQLDVTSFNSGNSNRDSHAMEVIDAISYPDVRFLSKEVKQSGDSLYVTGKLAFHGVTRNAEMSGITKWSEQKLTVEGNMVVKLSDFNIERPSLLMIPVDDDLVFSLSVSFILP
jgi:polyisoprenoid-binding protein YceI